MRELFHPQIAQTAADNPRLAFASLRLFMVAPAFAAMTPANLRPSAALWMKLLADEHQPDASKFEGLSSADYADYADLVLGWTGRRGEAQLLIGVLPQLASLRLFMVAPAFAAMTPANLRPSAESVDEAFGR